MSLFNSIIHGLKTKIDAQNAYKDAVILAVRDVLGVTIGHDAVVSLKESVLRLQVSPTVKSAIVLKKEILLQKLKEYGLSVTSIN